MQTLGEFYKENILCRDDLIIKTLPNNADEVKIEKGLFGWRLFSGKGYINCNSEYEARYLKVWAKAMVTEIKIPKDEEYLKAIVPELEDLKKKIDEIVEDELNCVLSPKIRAQILHRIWMEITK